ncbi:MAG: hypothetical protein ACODAD_12595 [Planctomycetota bacterium]
MDDDESGTSAVEIEGSDGNDSATRSGKSCRLRAARVAAVQRLNPAIAAPGTAGGSPAGRHGPAYFQRVKGGKMDSPQRNRRESACRLSPPPPRRSVFAAPRRPPEARSAFGPTCCSVGRKAACPDLVAGGNITSVSTD